MRTLRVSAKSSSNSIADAVAEEIRVNGIAEIQSVGADALNKAIEAIAIARANLTPSGVDIVCIPALADMIIDGEKKTEIRLTVEPKK